METINDEIQKLKSEIQEKSREITSIEKKIKKLRDEVELPDYVGKCLYSKNGITSTYIKVDNISKSDWGISVEGLYITVTSQAERTTYNVINHGYFMSISDFEIITEDKFNKALNDAIKSFNR